MSEKKVTKKTKAQVEEATEVNSIALPSEVLQLFVGVNFTEQDSTTEIRLEAGIVELGILPPRFENFLIETKRARIRVR